VGHEGLGVELHPLHRVLAMANSHNGVILGPGSYLQAVGEPLTHHDEGVVAYGGEGVGKPAKNAGIIMVDQGRLAVHNFVGGANNASIAITNALVPQTDAKDGYFGAKVADDIVGDAGILGGGGAGGDYDALWLHPLNLLERCLVVADYPNFFSQFTQVLEEVVGEAIVVID